VVLTEVLQRRRLRAEALATDNARLYDEQRGAFQTLQRNLLPRQLPATDGYEIGVRYAPGVAGTDVGGDWYDVVEVNGSRILVVGDVSGRGLAAASVMASARFAIRTLAAQGLSPADILTTVNGLDAGERDGHFATVLCARLDPDSGALELATAGHPPALLLTGRGARFLEAPIGPPVGATSSARYTAATATVPRGATLVFVTDGLFERRGEGIDVGLERLRSVAAGAASAPLEELLDTLVVELTGGVASDDAAILAVRRSTTRRRPRGTTPSGGGSQARRGRSGSR
jgi:serine phosphatase RsbU (regulator of sigma subunit)